MQLPYSENLEIQYLSRLFDNTSECYKFFWFQAIVTKILEGKTELSYGELLDEMIADAWYIVTEYHLNLGPKDNLEALVKHISQISGMKSSEKKSVILDYLQACEDKEVVRMKRILINQVPYRLQAPFMHSMKGKEWDVASQKLIDRINREKRLLYYFTAYNGLGTAIIIQPEWCQYILKNQEIIKGWLQYNIILYLQKRNPSVPGIADKLCPPHERKLEKVKKYWKLILTLYPVHEIYSDIELDSKDLSIDHFVPWSYVAHDEFWNLHPTTRGINSSKSNNLPDWNIYFPRLCVQEFFSYEMMWKHDAVHVEFEKCAKEHLNNEDVKRRVYRKGLTFSEFSASLEEVIQPIYQSAKNCGFKNWIYKEDVSGSDNILL